LARGPNAARMATEPATDVTDSRHSDGTDDGFGFFFEA
jgi:hypothetical protein